MGVLSKISCLSSGPFYPLIDRLAWSVPCYCCPLFHFLQFGSFNSEFPPPVTRCTAHRRLAAARPGSPATVLHRPPAKQASGQMEPGVETEASRPGRSETVGWSARGQPWSCVRALWCPASQRPARGALGSAWWQSPTSLRCWRRPRYLEPWWQSGRQRSAVPAQPLLRAGRACPEGLAPTGSPWSPLRGRRSPRPCGRLAPDPRRVWVRPVPLPAPQGAWALLIAAESPPSRPAGASSKPSTMKPACC